MVEEVLAEEMSVTERDIKTNVESSYFLSCGERVGFHYIRSTTLCPSKATISFGKLLIV